MSKASKKRTSTRAKLLLPVLFGLVLVALLAAGVIPSARKIIQTRATIEDLEISIKDQKTLIPIYVPLQKRQNESLPKGISLNEIEPLKVEDLADLPNVFEGLARRSEVDLVSVTPQVRSLQGGRELLRVDTRVRGEFPTFNKLLHNLNEMRFVGSIESIAIDVTDLGQEMSLSVWLTIQ